MEMKLELVPMPVTDIDRARVFYSEKIGFVVDLDVKTDSGARVCQLTPPGSACSIVLSKGFGAIDSMKPGTIQALHLVVADVSKARDLLMSRGVECGAIDAHPQGIKYVPFHDPDGNLWLLQEMPWRSGEFKD